MPVRRWPCFVFAVVLSAAGVAPGFSAAADTASKDALFAQYPVAAIYSGPVHLPDFKGRDRNFRLFRTTIREGLREGANLAGHFSLRGWGCGTDCVTYVVGDVRTGKLFDVSLGGEEYPQLVLYTKRTSQLVVARWISSTGKYSKDDFPIENCMGQNLLWDGSSLRPLAEPAILSTAVSDEMECDL